jgi:L,D-transpeptidase ErfK/SrfK
MRLLATAILLASLAAHVPSATTRRVATEVVGAVTTYQVQSGDTFASLGARHGIEPPVLARRNGRSLAKALRPGEHLLLDARHIVWPAESGPGTTLVINVPQRMLFRLVDGRTDVHYPVAVGRATWPTPVGAFTIVEKEVDPTWDVPISIQREMRRQGKPVITSIPPCPANPLGKHWIRLSHPGVGVHGTNAPASIYRFTTHGCIRLHPDDVCELFGRVNVGDGGMTVYDPVLLARLADGRIFAEVHPDIYGRAPDPLRHLQALADQADLAREIDWSLVVDAIRLREGVAVDVTRTVLESSRQGAAASLWQ